METKPFSPFWIPIILNGPEMQANITLKLMGKEAAEVSRMIGSYPFIQTSWKELLSK
jgi:hypothetical protein